MKFTTLVPAGKQRRQFLKQSLTTAAALTAGSHASASLASALYAVPSQHSPIPDMPTPAATLPERRLRLINDHTWEKLDVVYWADGDYVIEGLKEINYLLRDHRAQEVKRIDVNLIDDMHALYNSLESEERIHILSGYRSQATNNKLRSRSNGVAKKSLHIEGRAVDLYVPGRTTKQIQQAALTLKAGGVGYYPSSGFVHIDTGIVRAWSGS